MKILKQLSITFLLLNIMAVSPIQAGNTELKPAQSVNKEAKAVVQNWLKSWDNQQYDQGRKYVSQSMTNAVSFNGIKSTLIQRREGLGKVINRKLVEVVPHQKIYSFPEADYIAFIFESEYSKNKSVRELIRVINENGRWLIFSDLLLQEGQYD